MSSSSNASVGVRSLSTIASEIRSDWKHPNYGAVPYMEEMESLRTLSDSYGCDGAQEIVLRFLVNAGTWRGPVAKAIKAELNGMMKVKR